ncbi:uncharacterized protein Dwil_GK18906 [Drosophila willistoni]|uniref:Uncharacterized protein n=1 Tax=Drosophila willistoni TaxID=7260 RepID=A0A0Q9WQV6_DROWI|nr:uncharacterized protein Dwil_GK18906 [Drosophila willistoni]
MFNFSELRRSMNNDIVSISGNFSIASTWKIEPTDRVGGPSQGLLYTVSGRHGSFPWLLPSSPVSHTLQTLG